MKAIDLSHKVVSSEAWLEARKGHLAKEKEFTRLRDELSRQRREAKGGRNNDRSQDRNT